MDDIELRAECVRLASKNLEGLARDTDMLLTEAQKYYDFIMCRATAPLKQAA